VTDKEYRDLVYLLVKFQLGSDEKAEWWMNTKNTLLGNMVPLKLIQIGRGKKLVRFVVTLMGETWR
jgi:hypothetical protein